MGSTLVPRGPLQPAVGPALRPRAALPGAGLALAGAALVVALVSWGGEPALLGGIAAVAAVAMLALLLKADCLYVPELLLVALLSANYNVFYNNAAFIEGGTALGRLVTPVAVAGLAVFAAAEWLTAQRHNLRFAVHPADYAAAGVAVAATLALLLGAWRDNNPVWLLGDYGQLLYVVLAYAVVRLRYARLGPEALRTFLVLLAVSWGARAVAELLFPEFRGTPLIDLGNGILEPRRTDPLAPVALPLLLGLVLSERRPERMTLLLAALTAVLLQTLLGFTRTYYVTMLLSFGLVALLGLRQQEARTRIVTLVAVTGGGLVLALLLIAPVRDLAATGIDYFTTLFDADTPSRVHRETESRLVLDTIEASPLVGHGLGYEYVGVQPGTLQPVVVHFVHNSYLALWQRGGLLLLLPWVGLIVGGLATLLGRPAGTPDRMLVLCAGAGVATTAIAGLGAEPMYSYVLGPALGLVIATAVSSAPHHVTGSSEA